MQAVSCDEAFLDVPDPKIEDHQSINNANVLLYWS